MKKQYIICLLLIACLTRLHAQDEVAEAAPEAASEEMEAPAMEEMPMAMPEMNGGGANSVAGADMDMNMQAAGDEMATEEGRMSAGAMTPGYGGSMSAPYPDYTGSAGGAQVD
jgi:hypothetical protein